MKYKISELAKLLDVSTNTVRRYEDMGYIYSVRDDNSGYRYYNDDAIFGIVNARLMRKYEFTHEELDDMLQYNLTESIEAFVMKMQEIDSKIEYMQDVRHRMKDDLLLMRKAQVGCELYEKKSVGLVYTLFKNKDKIVNEADRLTKIQQFLYECPEVQRIYITRKDTIDNGSFELIPGIAVKQLDLERCNMTENEFTERYPSKHSVMGMVKIPNREKCYAMSKEDLRELVIGKHLNYIKEHDMQILDDVIAIVISRVVENGEEFTYLLVSVPVE